MTSLLELIFAIPHIIYVGILLPLFFVTPNTKELGKQYFNAVRNGNENIVIKLAGEEVDCIDSMRKLYSEDRSKTQSMEIRNIIYQITPNLGSSESIEGVWIKYEYKRPQDTNWQQGVTSLITNYDARTFKLFYPRTACGSDDPWMNPFDSK